MDALLLFIKAGLGILLGLNVGRTESHLAGGVLAGLLGDTAILTFIISSSLVKVGRDLRATGEDYTELDINATLRSRAFFITLGMFMAGIATCAGWRGLPLAAAVAIPAMNMPSVMKNARDRRVALMSSSV